MDLMQAISAIPGIGPFLPWIIALMWVCAGLATVVSPTNPLYRIINILGSNVGKARNATDPKA